MDDFAHPVEAEWARLFDAYRIRWLYEPHMFILTSDEDGLPTRGFRPDFYLIDHDKYVEVTTARRKALTRKRKKIRLAMETYPGLRIKLLTFDDYCRVILGNRFAPATDLAVES